MKVDISPAWRDLLKEEISKPYFLALATFVDNAYRETTCFPPMDAIFAAFNRCALDDLKVVILGQDPYHGAGQANGLCFAVSEDQPHPPSLKNIFIELASDIPSTKSTDGSLVSWAEQGVLLLNATLTVAEGKAGSHQKKGWETFTDAVIKLISDQKQHVVFLLWGNAAQKKGAKIDRTKHLVLTSGHPSPLSANRGFWFGNKHFSQTNAYLLRHNLSPIQW
ncbi:uracil-DNA glycosylase [Flavobacteriaceae bacterium F08102]|nr:uracil-DNA glycosylase [Flavobacteriaceae bacterium F08102]